MVTKWIIASLGFCLMRVMDSGVSESRYEKVWQMEVEVYNMFFMEVAI